MTFTPSLPPFGDRRRIRVGLLGGSFNPAHDGHVHLSREALRRLGLAQVWWLVSPQNPLKPSTGMAPLAARLKSARTLVDNAGLAGRVVVTDVERRLGVTRTAETLHRLRRFYPATDFVWLMGADNLAQLSRWWRWTDIFHTARVAVFDRSPYSYGALAGSAANRFRRARRAGKALWNTGLPAWAYIAIRRHPASATALRRAPGNARKRAAVK
jgi:nicotinate-nucleotide adenylyltransferase